MRAPKQPSDVASDTTPTPKGKTDHSRIVAHIDGTPGKPNPNSVTITTATHTGQAVAPSGESPTCTPHRHRQAAFGGTPTPFGSRKPASNLI